MLTIEGTPGMGAEQSYLAQVEQAGFESIVASLTPIGCDPGGGPQIVAGVRQEAKQFAAGTDLPAEQVDDVVTVASEFTTNAERHTEQPPLAIFIGIVSIRGAQEKKSVRHLLFAVVDRRPIDESLRARIDNTITADPEIERLTPEEIESREQAALLARFSDPEDEPTEAYDPQALTTNPDLGKTSGRGLDMARELATEIGFMPWGAGKAVVAIWRLGTPVQQAS